MHRIDIRFKDCNRNFHLEQNEDTVVIYITLERPPKIYSDPSTQLVTQGNISYKFINFNFFYYIYIFDVSIIVKAAMLLGEPEIVRDCDFTTNKVLSVSSVYRLYSLE